MRKKIVLFLVSIIFLAPAFADDSDWSTFDNVDNAWDGQKIITNKQFEETMQALEERKNKKANKQKEKAIRKFKGSSLHDNMDVRKDEIKSQTPLEEMDECQLINIPVDFILDGKAVEKGFYRIIGEKKADGVYIELFQAHKMVAKIKARETNDDFEQEYIQFAKLIPHNDQQMKIIFGSLAFNAYAYINIINPEYYSY